MIRIVINGADGRMGRAVAAAALETDDVGVVGGVTPDHDGFVIPGWPDAPVAAGLDGVSVDFDVLVDFSRPEGAEAAARHCAAGGHALVTGTTGLGPKQLEAINMASRSVAVIAAPNFSVGITMLLELVERAAHSLGPEVDVEILEAHHRHKADAPSGTALRLGEAVAAQRGVDIDRVACFDRRAEEGPRTEGSIGFASLRAGDVIGEHQVLFGWPGERLELSHRASDRGIFARGALRAVRWATTRGPGRYDMRDVLGLKGADA